MTIRDIPRFGERLRMIEEAWLREDGRALPVPALYGQGFTLGIVAGVEWASEQADQAPSDAEVLAALNARELSVRERNGAARHFNPAPDLTYYSDGNIADIRAALLAAQEVRRNGD